MLLLGLSEEGAVWMRSHAAVWGWRGAVPSWSFSTPGVVLLAPARTWFSLAWDSSHQALAASSTSPGGEASKNNLSEVDTHTPGLSQEHLAAAALPAVSWCHQASHAAEQGHESSWVPVIQRGIAPVVWVPLAYSTGTWHLEGCMTSWHGSSSWETR